MKKSFFLVGLNGITFWPEWGLTNLSFRPRPSGLWPERQNFKGLKGTVLNVMDSLVTLAFHIKWAKLALRLKFQRIFHFKCPASASRGIVNIMAANRPLVCKLGVGGLSMSFVGQPHRR